jgi:hypothetical protein
MMEALLDLQEAVYRIYATIKGDSITKEEKAYLELRVKVQPGCTELLVPFLEALIKGAKKLSVPKILAITIPVSIAIIASAGVLAFGNATKEKIAAQKEVEIARIESTTMTDLQKEESARFVGVLEVVEKAMDVTEAANKRVFKTLASFESADIHINGSSVSHDELKEFAKPTKTQKAESKSVSIKGEFRIGVIDFDGKAGTEISMVSTDGQGYEFKKVIIPEDLLSDKQYDIINKGIGHESFWIHVIAQEKNGVLSSPLLVEMKTSTPME